MFNVIWYIGLALISVVITINIIYKKRSIYAISTFVVFYLFTSTITWIGEFTVLGIFDSYAYKTGLFQDIWAQNLLGHLLLNATMFPAAAIAVVTYSLEYKGMAFISVIFVLAEYIFVKLGIYEQHWWRYYMSVINVIAFMIISKKWFYKMNRERYGLTRAITFYFAAFIFIHIPAPVLTLLGKLHYQLSFVNNIFGNFYRSSIMVSFTYHLIITGIFVYCVCILKKWYWKMIPYMISIVIPTIFAKVHILVISDDWRLIYYIIIELISITAFILLEKHALIPLNDDKANR